MKGTFQPKEDNALLAWRQDRKRLADIKVPKGGTLPEDSVRLLRVSTNYFVAGAIFKRTNGVWGCAHAAPIIGWMKRKSPDQIKLSLLKMGADYEWICLDTPEAGGFTGQHLEAAETAVLDRPKKYPARKTNCSLPDGSQRETEQGRKAPALLGDVVGCLSLQTAGEASHESAWTDSHAQMRPAHSPRNTASISAQRE